MLTANNYFNPPTCSPTCSRRDNLYNTNEQFDYGGFRELIEAQSQTSTSTTLFAYRFRDPGVYVFYLSSDVNKRIVRTTKCFVSFHNLVTQSNNVHMYCCL